VNLKAEDMAELNSTIIVCATPTADTKKIELFKQGEQLALLIRDFRGKYIELTRNREHREERKRLKRRLKYLREEFRKTCFEIAEIGESGILEL
jgi:hypothetical protein